MLISRVLARTRLIATFEYRYWRRRLRGGHLPVVSFYPHLPGDRAVAYKIGHVLGATMTNRLKAHADVIISWEDTTRRQVFPELTTLAAQRPVLNLRCVDISKQHVERVHRRVFGYGSLIDPRVGRGLCVRKSDQNAAHDGTVIQCPIASVDDRFVYQRVIDNVSADGMALDIRVPVFGSTIPFCYLKRRPLAQRFSNENSAVDLCEVGKLLRPDEVERLLKFCDAIGLDYGELDVLRDNGDGRIYVVDVNNTPDGPPNHLPDADTELALQRMIDAFTQEFLPAFHSRAW